ncbi:MAG TPA: glycosyltransferase [Allosphingosinicella sp.]|nr:glycosyltransferase [Allosphingosinicella sp.]
MRILYPLLWSRLGREACREQSVSTAAALARQGHEVTLLMPRRRQDAPLEARDLRAYFRVEGDFRLVQRSSRWAGEGVLTSLMWLRQVFGDSEAARADLLYSRIPAMLAAGHLAPIPFATDHYRRWPDDLPAIRPLFRRTARHPNCAGLVLHSDYAAGSYRRLGIEEQKLLVAHNGFDPPAARPDRAASRARLGLPGGRAIALYAGRINPEKGLDQVLALAALRPEILFLLVGSQGEGAIEREAAALANVRVLPWAEPDILPLWLSAADILLVPPSSAPLERFRNCILPMKLFSYLAAERPLLAPIAPDTAELLEHERTALLVPPDRPRAAAAALDRLLGDPGLAARLGANALRLSSGLTWDRRAEKISAFLEERLLAIAERRRSAQRSLYSSTVAPVSATMTGAAQAPTAAGK